MNDTAPRRILFLANDDRFFHSHRLPLARAARAAGAEVAVAAPPGAHRERIEAGGLRFFPVRYHRGGLNPAREVRPFLDVLAAYRRFRPHLAHHLTFKPIVQGAWAARHLGGVPVVNALTGLGYVFTDGGPKRRLLRTVAQAGYRYALGGPRSLTIFQNPDDRDLFVAGGLVRAEQTRVILGSGVDPERFVPQPEPPPPVTILLAARMLWDKGVGELVEVARLLRDRRLSVRVLLAGAPDPANPAAIPESQLRTWQDEGLVEWLGQRGDMPALIAACHIVCLPSYREGLPLSLIEAAACGRPIVTTDMPGCREVVQHGTNGLLVPPRDPIALAEALRRLIENAELRATLGAAGRERVLERFTVQRVIEQTFAVYEELLGGPLSG